MTAPTSTAAPAAAAVCLREVEMRFGAVRALRDITFVVPRGSLCGLVGPNGAGKTTTLRLVATDLAPQEGEVSVLGRTLPREAAAVRSRIGYMPDAAGLYEELTLEEYLGFFAAFYGLPRGRRAEAVATAMELASVKPFARRRLVGLSKGERQRVLLSRAVLHDPELLVLDEPADGLDPRGRVELRELLLLLHERGKTILISSHILADLEEICTDLVLVDRGRVLYAGARDQLFASGFAQGRVRVECLDGPEPVLRLVDGAPGVAVLGHGDGAVELGIPPDPRFAADLLRRLVEADLRIASFARTAESLEAVYLRLTERGES